MLCREMLRHRIAFNCAFICFTAGVSFWLGIVVGLYQAASVALNFQMYGNIVIVAIGLLGMAIVTTLPVSPTAHTLLHCQSETEPLLCNNNV